MKITDVRIYKVNSNGSLIANASITFDDEFVVYVKLINSANGTFISMPSHSYDTPDGVKYVDDCFPLSKEFRDMMTDAVIEAYNNDEKPKSKSTATRKRVIKK